MFQTYAPISGISPSTGSQRGGTRLTLTGKHFDETTTKAKVKIGDTDCNIVEPVTDTQIVCVTAADPGVTKPLHRGNRGLAFEIWNETYTDLASIGSLSDNASDYVRDRVDVSDYTESNMNNYVTRMTGFFVAPRTSEYRFYVMGDDQVELYLSTDDDPANKVKMCEASVDSTYFKSASQKSSKVNLTEGQSYYMEVLHREGSSRSFVTVAARAYSTDITNTMTGKAWQEKQKLVFSSTVVKEELTVVLSTPSAKSATKEVQTVLASGNANAPFRLGVMGVYTEPLLVSTTAAQMQTALNKLPVIAPDTVTVTATPQGAGNSYSITFNTDRGDISDITYQLTTPNITDLTITVTEATKGAPTLSSFSFDMDGIPSPALTATATASEVRSALLSLFSSGCPSDIGKPSDNKFFQDYESGVSSKFGERRSDREPFCGRFSSRNPRYLYDKGGSDVLGISLSQYNTLCFAYRGVVKSVGVRFTYEDSEREKHSTTASFSITAPDDASQWSYHCENIYDVARAHRSSGSDHRVDRLTITRQSSSLDLYVDVVTIVRKPTTTETDGVNLRRLPQARPNGVFIRDVEVTSSEAGQYTVKLDPHACGNEFPLLGVAYGKLTSGDVSNSSSSAVFSISNGGSKLGVEITRVNAASPPIGGGFSVSYKGQTTEGMPPTATAEEVTDQLQALSTLGNMKVEREGSCSNFEYIVTWLDQGGNLDEMTLDASLMTGSSVTASVVTVTDGSLWYDPIVGDMLRTGHSKAQVQLFINDIPSHCETDCSYEWTSGTTPTITSITPTSGTEAQSTTATIAGSGFDTNINNTRVVIAGVACTVTAATTSSITCNVGNGPTGNHNVKVIVESKGEATGSVQFSYVSDITAISPSNGSIAGGTALTITGYGFTNDGLTYVDGVLCPSTSVTPGQIVCLTPKSSSTSGAAVAITVSQNSANLTSPSQFTYDASASAIISSVSVTSSSVEGGAPITISGTGFGASADPAEPLTIGGKVVNITSYSDTEIVATLPSNAPGSYQVQLQIGGQGVADLRINSIANIDYTLKVTNISPSRGSLYGGTRVTITGEGFLDSNTLVSFGPHACVPDVINSTQIVCTIQDTGVVHEVKNTGTHTHFGYGYAWNPSSVEVNVGDSVKWSWTTPKWVSGIGYRIAELMNASTTVEKTNGVTSGSVKVPNGQYQYKFGAAGNFHYWSGYADEFDTISFKGKVTVVQAPSHAKVLRVTVAGHEAVYQPGGSDPASDGPCPGIVDPMDGCTESEPADVDVSKFNFKFWRCSSPVVTDLNLRQGSSVDELIVQGSGFSFTSCQNEVKIGDAVGVVQSSTNTSVSFKIDATNAPSIGSPGELSVRIGNRGNAAIALPGDLSRRFVLLPVIESMSPSSGSTGGGTLVTLSGSGFQGTKSDVFVSLQGYECVVESLNYTDIVCATPSGPAGEVPVSVTVQVGGNALPVSCNTSCNYNYSTDLSPTVSAVSPATVNTSSTSLTITGTMFGSSASDVTVTVGGVPCVVSGSVSDTSIMCDVGDVPVGTHTIDVRLKGKGKAVTSSTVQSLATISSFSPSSGSVNGEVILTITGNGFVTNSIAVTVDGNSCTIVSVHETNISCIAPSHAAGSVDVVVTSAGTTYPSETFTYSSAATPTVSSVTPTNGIGGNAVTIAGTGYSSTNSDNAVTVGGVTCTVTASSPTSITCTLGDQQTGAYPIKVVVSGSGASAQTVEVTYEMDATGVSPSSGGIAGGQTMTVAGTGFIVGGTNVTVCGVDCLPAPNASQTAVQFVCLTPSKLNVVGTESCDVVVTVNGIIDTLSSVYTYDASLTSDVTGVSPTRGGTGGGTNITITGTGFGSTTGAVTVTIGGADCSVSTVTTTEITCISGATSSQKTQVVVEINGNGMAKQTNADFEYIDVWSSKYTWGGLDPPTKGDLVVVPKGQILLLDTDTPILKMLIIQGGELIFDEKDINLNAENILITDGGKLQVGTEAEPFQHKAVITMHGNFRSPELPIYGAKTLAVREGILDLHGKVTPVTWTRLAVTATAGDTTIVLQHPVNWEVGDQIVIATTGGHHSQKESEIRSIVTIAADNVTLTLDSALTYTHIGITRTFSGVDVDFRAEVGLLTHNVVVRGSRDIQWDEKIEACPAGFDTGEFATQTCFQGRFGDEMGSDEFGSSIMIHAPRKDEDLAKARISHIEVTHAGQAFRLGRYPIHFHLNGDMSSSYVRGCSIHHTFNRAVNVHGTHNTFVEHNVLYDVKGGAFFLEDGIETGNYFRYNLGVFVRASTSLLNDDVTPATFWLTNPNNTVSHNAAAGGSHFGFWYRMHKHPEGPSFTSSVCCQNVPLGEFRNNTAHSFGWFGLWIFEFYFPKVDGSCSSSAADVAAKFESFTAWNCEKGAEAVQSGSLQFIDFILVNNKLAGYEGKLLGHVPQFDEANGPMVKGGLIVGHHPDLASEHVCTRGGIVLPYNSGLLIRNVSFINFDKSVCSAFSWTRISGTCSDQCGGFLYKSSGLQFTSSPNKASYGWEHEGVIEDEDGTLTGTAGGSIVPTTGILPPTKCTETAAFSMGIAGSVCDETVRFHRFAFKDVNPTSLKAKNISLTNAHGTSIGKYREKRISHKPGWMVVLPEGEDYSLTFVNAEHLTNISFNGQFYDFASGQYITMAQQAEKPDRFKVGGATINETVGGFNTGSDVTGSWTYDEGNGKIQYLVSGNTGSRKKRAISYSTDRTFHLQAFRCYYRNCQPPPAPETVLTRPPHITPWSLNSSWEFRTGGKPIDNDNVTIDRDYWILADEEFPLIDTLIIHGGLEFENNATKTFNLRAKYIIIYGRLVVGWAHDPFPGVANIILSGSHSTPVFPVNDGPTLGSKVIAVYGGLDMHGLDPGVTWTRLGVTAAAGDNSITLSEPVSWAVDSEIVITTTSYKAWDTETFKITAVSANNLTLTLNGSLAHLHIAVSETVPNGRSYNLAAKVGLLTRNIKIIGEDYAELFSQSFGARLLVARTADSTMSYSGFAKIQNVEFFHTGQEGYTMSYDPRFSVAFVDVSNVGERSSYVRRNAFHNCFSRAIGAFGISDLLIEDNVVHHTVGPGIVSNSDNSTLIRNLVTLSIWPGGYQDRVEPLNEEYEGGIEAIAATNLVLRDNVVAGSERMGYHTPGDGCTGNALWSGNEAHSNLMGVGIFPKETGVSGTCIRYSNVIAWKNVDFGFYYNNPASFLGESLVSVENGVGVFPFVVGPGSVAHQTSDKYVTVRDSFFVGKTSAFDCTSDVVDQSDVNIQLSSVSRSWGNGTHGKVGISWPNFSAGPNNAPDKPFIGVMAYQAISGIMHLTNVTFANFGTSCTSSHDYAITTNPNNDDCIHPIESQSLAFHNVQPGNKLFIHIPRVGKINSADCVDMDCDGLKKAFIKDLDGSILGTPGAAIPLSEHSWNGDPRRGLGDYRVPKVMQTALDGTKIPLDYLAPFKGVYRNPSCVYHDDWRAYECHDLDYEMLVIESMDPDTETRRLSPVAILSEGYLDLINGPQDHGWCSGYTCRKRLSTFQAIVATNKTFDIYFTSTTPQTTRYHLLNSNSDQSVRIGVWFGRPNRLDVYVGGNTYVMPKNGETKNGRFSLRTDMTPTQFMPDPATDVIGTNYIDREEKMVFFVVTGAAFVEIRTASVIIVSYTLPAMTVDEFFGENLVSNLAAFLNVDPRKIRIVDVINEQSVGRRKRSAAGTKVNVEIGDEPGDSSPLAYSDIQQLETSISNGVALGTMNVLPNGTVPLSVGLITSTPPVDSAEWQDVSVDDEPYVLNKAGSMAVHETPVPGRELKVFDTPIRLRVYDDSAEPLSIVGSNTQPWQVTANLTLGAGSHSSAVLQGATTVSFSNGWANFTDLAISHPGSDYSITFTVVSPVEAGNFTTTVSSLTVLARRMTAEMVSTTTDPLEGELISLTLELRDKDTGSALSDIAWRGHTWNVTVSLASGSILNGTLDGVFNPLTGRVDYTDLSIPEIGRYYLSFNVWSTPSEYNFTVETYVDVTTASLQNLVVEKSSACQFKFDVTYDAAQSPKDAAVFANAWAIKNKNNGVRVTGVSASPGSVIVTLTFEGRSSNVTGMISDLCVEVELRSTEYTFGGQSVAMSPYMMVDGLSYYGNCGAKKTSNGLHPAALAAIIILSITVVVLVVIFVVWKVKVLPKTKTSFTTQHMKYLGHVNTPWQAEDFLFRDPSHLGLKREVTYPTAPADTLSTSTMSPTNKFDMYIDSPISRSSSSMPLAAD
ncbi:fibrocystin-L-like [Haliotis rufescens]|uniref:fibrocystin-L-like n=1 Tax=Haliotis rufescens TaxID=6454 RepID=UPI00201F2F6A|nr:fibrocystin-L-like [Haliotis rufescens]